MSGRWLIKSEPGTYSWDDLVREGEAVWDGVRNAQAANFLRAMRMGDALLFYHSGPGAEVVGIGEVCGEAFPDPKDTTGRFVAVSVRAVRPLARPVSLAAMKADARLSGMMMLRQSRLSVSPVSDTEWAAIVGR